MKKVLLVAAVAAGFAACAIAVDNGTLPFSANTKSQVTLTVLDGRTGEVVAGAAVKINVFGTDIEGTAGEGNFTWANVASGVHPLVITASGYREFIAQANIQANNTDSTTTRQNVFFAVLYAAGSGTQDVNVRVLNSDDNSGVEGADVRVYLDSTAAAGTDLIDTNFNNGTWQLLTNEKTETPFEGTTDASGTVTIAGADLVSGLNYFVGVFNAISADGLVLDVQTGVPAASNNAAKAAQFSAGNTFPEVVVIMQPIGLSTDDIRAVSVEGPSESATASTLVVNFPYPMVECEDSDGDVELFNVDIYAEADYKRVLDGGLTNAALPNPTAGALSTSPLMDGGTQPVNICREFAAGQLYDDDGEPTTTVSEVDPDTDCTASAAGADTNVITLSFVKTSVIDGNDEGVSGDSESNDDDDTDGAADGDTNALFAEFTGFQFKPVGTPDSSCAGLEDIELPDGSTVPTIVMVRDDSGDTSGVNE